MTSLVSFFDTATQPTAAMRDAMRAAAVGDDVYGLDPTVNELEQCAAALLGKDAAVFLPSGTMANLVAVLAQTRHGDAVVAEASAHLVRAEGGGVAAVAGCMPVPLAAADGILRAEHVEPWLQPPDQHRAPVRLVCVENTHNRAGGTATPPRVMRELRDLCAPHGVRIHVDGSRLLHAALALDVAPTELTAEADSVCIALSKALGAPAGSLLAGSAELVAQARHKRKLLGGGMRQAGVLAAAGLLALADWRTRLEEDHRRATALAALLDGVPGLTTHPRPIPTNIVYCDASATGLAAEAIARELLHRELFCAATSASTLRFVVHGQIGDEQIDALAGAMREIVAEG